MRASLLVARLAVSLTVLGLAPAAVAQTSGEDAATELSAEASTESSTELSTEADPDSPPPTDAVVAEAAVAEVPIAPAPIRFRLANGLSVILAPVPGRRFSAVAVTYHVGAAEVPEGWTGLAHLTEHLMFSGTDVLDEVEVYLRLEAAGAIDRNGETGPDRSVFYEVLPSAQLEQALYLESHRMARLLAGLNEARVARQREVVLHEGWERGSYGWRGLLASRLYAGVFPDTHPYARAIVERADDVAQIELRHVQWFFQRHYGPANATLVVVGGFDLDATRASIERRFGPIRASAPTAPEPVVPALAPLSHERRVTVEIQHDRDQVYVAWPTPALYAPGDAELDVLSTLLLGRRDAPLRAALIESGLALEAEVRQRSHELASVFTIHAVPAPGRSNEEVVQVIDRVLDEVRRAPFDEAAVVRERARWARDTHLGLEDLATRAIRLGIASEQYAPTLDEERRRYLDVDAAEVAAVVRAWLPPRRRLVLVGAADPSAAPAGRVRQDDVVLP